MHKIILGLAVGALSLSVLSSSAQTKPSSFIGISGGISMPVGNWGKSEMVSSTSGFTSSPAGFASKGPLLSVDGAYFFSKHFGVGALFNYATYKTKDLNTLSAGYQESFDVDQVTTTAGRYKSWSILPGIYFNQPLSQKLSFRARGLAGITHTTTPRISVNVMDSDIDDGTFQQLPASKTAFALDGGIGLNYNIWKKWSLNLNGDYFYSKPSFTIQNTQRNNAAGRLITAYNEPLSGVNITLGIAYAL